MDIKIRKCIYKIPILHRTCKAIVDFNNWLFYKRFSLISSHADIMKELHGAKNGARCFIVGNGPSLTLEDLEKIKYEDCFASNLIFKLFNRTTWRPIFYFLQDRYADVGSVIDDLDLPYLFIGDYFWRKRRVSNSNALCFHGKRWLSNKVPEFSEDISNYIVDCHTVTYSMIQCAVYLGYREIYLLGMDHNYSLVCDENGNVLKTGMERSHVFEDDNPEEVVANLEEMNKAYIAARDYASSHGIKIINCTRGGKLEWFERKSLESVLGTADVGSLQGDER